MIADPRIAVTVTDCDNLLKDIDNPAGCKPLLSARVAIRLRVLRTVSEFFESQRNEMKIQYYQIAQYYQDYFVIRLSLLITFRAPIDQPSLSANQILVYTALNGSFWVLN